MLVQWENQLTEDAEEQQEGEKNKSILVRIRRLRALASIAKGRPIAKIPMKELENDELAVSLKNSRKIKKGSE